MGATPQPPRNHPDGSGLIRWMKGGESQLSFLRERLNRPLANTGMSVPGPGVTQVDGSLVVQGGDAKSGNFATGSTGWHLDHTGNAEFNDLTLRGGIIGNDALTNPVIPQSVWKGTTADFSLNTGWTALTAQTQSAPSGASSVIVHGFVRLVATNTTASKDYLYSDLDIAGQSCGGFATPVAAGDVGTSFCSFARVLTGVSSVTLTAYGSTSTGTWATGTGNVCQISASVLWFR